jgi:hypothetical protein
MVSRVYGKTTFKIINVVNINKTPKNIYVIGNHHNSNKSIIITCIPKYGKCIYLIQWFWHLLLFLPTPKQLPSVRQG